MLELPPKRSVAGILPTTAVPLALVNGITEPAGISLVKAALLPDSSLPDSVNALSVCWNVPAATTCGSALERTSTKTP